MLFKKLESILGYVTRSGSNGNPESRGHNGYPRLDDKLGSNGDSINNGANSSSSWYTRLKNKVVSGYESIKNRKEIIQEKQDKQIFEESVKKRFKITDEKYARLLDVIEFKYQESSGLKTRDEILKEEINYSRQYQAFLDYEKSKPTNFIAKKIHEKVHEEYVKHQGKKSTARIFAEIKNSDYINVSFRYNEAEDRYEANVNKSSVDIRDLMIRTLQRNINFSKFGYTYDDYLKGKIDVQTKQKIKRNIFHALDYYTQEYGKELTQFGIKVSYYGADRIIEDKYKISKAKHNKGSNKSNSFYSGRYKDSRTFDLRPGR